MGSTTRGLPYPEGTDKVVDGDNAIRALAEAVDTKLVYNGKFSGLTSAAGVVLIPHGMGVIPTAAVVCMGQGNTGTVQQVAQPAVTNQDATNIAVTIIRSDTGAALASNNVVINWIAVKP